MISSAAKRDQCASGHGVVRHESGDLSLVLVNRTGDLQRGQYKPSGCVQDDVDRHGGIREVNGSQDFF